jgi:glycosyltransferase involved in cell wall biosynthesis
MAAMLLRSATRIYYSTGTWTRLMARYGPQSNVELLPVPATIPVDVPVAAVAGARATRRAPIVIGHFGTYGEHVAGELRRALPEILQRLPQARLLLLGRGSGGFAGQMPPELRARIDSSANADGQAIAAALRASDVLVQPFPDGVTTRRTSMMAALSSGVPTVTTDGALTEPIWRDSAAVRLAPAGDAAGLADAVAALAADAAARADLGARGRRLYDEQFALAVTLSRLRR